MGQLVRLPNFHELQALLLGLWPAALFGLAALPLTLLHPQEGVSVAWLSLPVFWAGLSHLAQIPAMVIAGRALAWYADGASWEINRRIHAVLRATIPLSLSALSALALLNFSETLSTALGLHLLLFVLGQGSLVLVRRLGSRRDDFERRRREIVYLIVGLGALVCLHARAMAESRLGLELCWALALLLGCRALLQLTLYRSCWPRQPFGMRLAHHALWLLFAAEAATYAATAGGLR